MKKVNKIYCLYLLLARKYKLDTTIKDLITAKDFIAKDKECVLSPETGQVFLSKNYRLHCTTISYSTIVTVIFTAILIHYFMFIIYLITNL